METRPRSECGKRVGSGRTRDRQHSDRVYSRPRRVLHTSEAVTRMGWRYSAGVAGFTIGMLLTQRGR
jgi:hypothetical protein